VFTTDDKEGTMHRRNHTTTRSTRSLCALACVLLASVAIPAGALAGGEPKNEYPFTRQVDNRVVQAAGHTSVLAPAGQGEAKNELPFTRRVAGARQGSTNAAIRGAGEPKNELPFTESMTAASVASGTGFSWIDAGLGTILGISLCVAGMGGVLLVRHRTPRTA
jgi:hypothetical protein